MASYHMNYEIAIFAVLFDSLLQGLEHFGHFVLRLVLHLYDVF